MEDIRKAYETYRKEIDSRLGEFSKLDRREWFNELVFCILTPQSNAEKCWNAVIELKEREFLGDIEACLIKNTRFYRNKTRYLKEAIEKWGEIERKLESVNEKNVREIRNWIAENVRGVGMKESSHFLRNTGKSGNQIAILDRHILRRLEKLKIINKTRLDKKNYLIVEEKMNQFSSTIGIPLDALDLLFWKIESGRIFK